jgi:putative membrane protein (TIGR04086 family)
MNMLVLGNKLLDYLSLLKSLQNRRERMTIESKNLGVSILYGLVTIFLVATISSIIFSLILRFTSTQESSLQFVVTAVSFISLFIGGFISGGKGKEKGWLLGGGTGLLYTIVIFLFHYLGKDSLFSYEQIIYHTCFMLVAMMGGILGVNMTTSRKA